MRGPMLLVGGFAAEQENPGSKRPQALQAQVLSCKLSHLAEPDSENGTSEAGQQLCMMRATDAHGCSTRPAPRASWRPRERLQAGPQSQSQEKSWSARNDRAEALGEYSNDSGANSSYVCKLRYN